MIYVRALLYLLLVLSVFFEVTLVPFPFFVFFAVILFIIFPDIQSLIVATCMSLVLDSLKATPFGFTAVFLCVVFLLISRTAWVFDLKDNLILLVALFITTALYGYMSSYSFHSALYGVIFCLYIGIVYAIYKKHTRTQW